MSVDLTKRNELPAQDRVQLSGTTLKATQFLLPAWWSAVSFRFEANVGRFSFDSANADDVAIGADYGESTANTWTRIEVRGQGGSRSKRATSLFLGAVTVSTWVQVVVT